MQGNLLHLVGSNGVSKITVILYVTPSSLVEQQQCFRKTFCFHDGRRWRRQVTLPTFLNLRSLRSRKTVCRGDDNVLILHHLAALCHCHLFTHYYNPSPWVDNSLCCEQHRNTSCKADLSLCLHKHQMIKLWQHGGTSPCILSPSARQTWAICITTQMLTQCTKWTRCWVGPTAGLDALEMIDINFPGQKTNISLRIHPTAQSLMWLSYPSSMSCVLPNAQHSSACKPNSCTASHEITHMWTLKVCIHKRLWLVSTLSHISPISNTTPYIRSMLILSSCLCPCLLTGLFHSDSFTDLSVLTFVYRDILVNSAHCSAVYCILKWVK